MAVSDRNDLLSIIEDDEEEIEIPETLPLLPVRDVVIFTDMVLPLYIGREKSIKAVEEAMAKDRFLVLATQKEPGIESPEPDQIYSIGTVGRILRILKLPDGSIKALVQGVAKARVLKYVRKKASFKVKIETVDDEILDKVSIEAEALMRNVRENSERMLSLSGDMPQDGAMLLEGIDSPGRLADIVASTPFFKLKIDESQLLLETTNPEERLRKVNDFLTREVELSSMQAKIQSEVRDEISKSQKDYFLREQMRAINRELGDFDEKQHEIEDYTKKIKKAKMSKEADKESTRQLRRLEQMHPDSAEASVIRTYLDWLVELPWSKSSKDLIDVQKAKKVLDKEHYGLKKIKDRILEYLSVRKLNPKMKGPILCFAGPPGVGKTSLGQAIARALGRKFVRISLGGIHDEAEIRGHRRTYIGALPGRILQGLKQAGTNNPVFMMDEIDKLGADFRGDPSSALLEALDPEQNVDFSDHYLNLSFDLSKVMFILTANITDTIPSALLDRMEIINLSGYTLEEKVVIAKKYLIPRQIKENGLKAKQITLSDNALNQVITEYTSEAGLRNLEREIGSLCRKTARKIAEKKKGPFAIKKNNLHKYLGVPQFLPEMDKEENQIGLATGLAWTHVGGEALYVEATLLHGKGELIMTGQLGDVMQESIRAAATFVKANLKDYGLDENILENIDVHIHVPAGAIPKDGPSAGIAIVTALVSAVTKIPVKSEVAMTGEITLRGRVLPIGGLKEKALGALRAGITTVLIPEKNEKDLAEIPKSLKKKLNFVKVANGDEVLAITLEQDPKKQAAKKKKAAPKKAAAKATKKKPAAKKPATKKPASKK